MSTHKICINGEIRKNIYNYYSPICLLFSRAMINLEDPDHLHIVVWPTFTHIVYECSAVWYLYSKYCKVLSRHCNNSQVDQSQALLFAFDTRKSDFFHVEPVVNKL